MKYSLLIIILLIIQVTKPFRKYKEAEKADTGHFDVTLNVNENSSLPDSIDKKNKPIPSNHQGTSLEEDSLNSQEDVWFWFIGINIYPGELKSN